MRYSQFLSLEIKQFLRSADFASNIFIKIVLFFILFIFLLQTLLLGGMLVTIIKETFPDEDPFLLINRYAVIWFFGEFVYRYLMQKLPSIEVKPFLYLPVKRKKIAVFLFAKSFFSFFNLFPLAFFIPMSIGLIFNGYHSWQVISWAIAMICISFSINFLLFLIDKSRQLFWIIVGVIGSILILSYFGFIPVFSISESIFYAFYKLPFTALIPVAIALSVGFVLYTFIRNHLYLDDGIMAKSTADIDKKQYDGLNRFGKIAPFLKNDIRLLLRNKRSKGVLISAILLLFYGLLFFPNSRYENSVFIVFGAIFSTGGFLLSFGQLVPSWDSEYFKLMMSQNIPFRLYLDSKWYIIGVVTFVSIILSLPYLYFGLDIYALIVGGGIFNIGVNSLLTLWAGTFNLTPVKLNEKGKFGQTQSFNLETFIISIPKILLPILAFSVPKWIFGFPYAGIFCLILLGIIGILAKNYFLGKIVSLYKKKKYKMIAAYAQK